MQNIVKFFSMIYKPHVRENDESGLDGVDCILK